MQVWVYQVDVVEGEWPREVTREIEIKQKGQFHKALFYVRWDALQHVMHTKFNQFVTYIKSMESRFAYGVS